MERRTRAQASTFGTLRTLVATALAFSVTLVVAQQASAETTKDGRGEARVVGSCSTAATSKLSLKARDGAIELEFEVEHARAGAVWRLAIVHERRVAWRGKRTIAGSSASFGIERRLIDLIGTDTVTVTAWAPSGAVCRATAVLRAG